MLDKVEKAGIGIAIKKDVKVGVLMFAESDDFVGFATNTEDLKTLINLVQKSNKWRLKSNTRECCYGIF